MFYAQKLRREDMKMNTRKYESPLGRDIGTSKATKGRGWKGLKGQAALALAVSLWIAGGGAAWAESVSENTTISDDKSSEYYWLNNDEKPITFTVEGPNGKVKYIAAYSNGTTINIKNGGLVTTDGHNLSITAMWKNNTINIESGGTVEGNVYGGNSATGELSDNKVIVAGTVGGQVYGGYTHDPSVKVSNNTVTVEKNGIVKATPGGPDGLYGGYSAHGVATHNTVTVKGTVKGNVYGGNSGISGGLGSNEGHNRVEILGGTVTGSVTGDEKNTFYNTVQLHDATVGGTVQGDGEEYDDTGNTLILSGVNVVNTDNGEYSTVQNFETIKFDGEKFEWDPTKTVLTAKKYHNASGAYKLDVSAVTAKAGLGTMTLLKATDSFRQNFKVGNTVIDAKLGNENTSATVQSTAKSSADEGITLGYNNTHTVNYDKTNKAINYTVANNVNKITLGTILWNKNGTARALTPGEFTFNDSTAIDKTSFIFNTPSDIKAGDSMTLLSNATGLTAGDSIAVSQSYTNYANSIKLDATLNGNITGAVDKLGYTATGTTLDSVDLTEWNGTATAVPDGWTSALGNSSITAVSVDRAGVAPGTERNILTSGTENFFNDNQITNALKYKEYAASSKTLSGVTLTSSESKGVKASDDGKNLVYARSKYNVSNISLGAMEWGLALTATYGYDYTNANLDFSKFTFTNPDAVTGSTILLDANNTLAEIAATEKKVSYAYSPVAGVTVNGIVNGSYMITDEYKLQYTATENKANKLTFGNVEWKDSGALIAHATDTTKNINFDGAAVDTSNINFTNISKLDANKRMTLVSDFGTAVVTPTGSKYKVNSILQGEGHAFFENNNLLYLVTKGVDGKADVSGNTEEITGGKTVTEDVIGATTISGTTESNKANVSGGSTVTGNVIGAETESGLVNKNEANVVGESKINGNVEAAQTKSGNATANITNVENSMVTGNAVGAVTDTGAATGNEVNITGGSVGGDVAGATSDSGTVSQKNQASVVNATVVGNVYGGKSTSGEINTSIANVSGGSVKGSVYGGQTDGDKKADGNQVKLEQEAKVQKDVYGGYSQQGTATGNKVTVDGATVDGTIYGGKSKDKSDNNSVELDNGTVGAIIGGGCEEASGNIIIIIGGEVLNGVYGAKAGSSATNNTITMSGGKVNNVLYGGYTESATGVTTGNTVNLYDTADVSNASVFGGNGSDITGNVLNIGTMINDVAHSWTGGGQSVKNIANFETMNYVAVPWSKDKAAVTISDGTASNLSATKVNAADVHFTDTTSLKNGDTMTLLNEQKVAADKRVQAGNITKESKYTAGSTLKGTGILSMDDSGNVIYKVTDKDSSDQSHNAVMGATASMAALSAGNDFVGSAVEGLGNSNNTGSDGLATYANLGGGSMNVETGSHVKTHTWNAILALGHKNEKKLSTTEYGAFFEYGTGNYSTFNGDERGDGSTRYTGGGILGKWQKNNGFYVEGSLRAGSIHDDANNVLWDVNGNPYSYTTDATYWGAHIGVGREIKLNKTDVLDLYAKYFYNHRGSVSFDAGGHYDLGAVESSVLRVGTRYTVKQNDNINYYGGLAVEHEFCGRASGFADGVAIRGADISGTSVRGEIGATFRPGEKSNVTLDLNLSGFAGKKQGLTGGISATFHF